MIKTLTSAERETIVRFSDDPDDLMTFETFNKQHALRLIASGATVKRTSVRGGWTYWTLEMPRAWFRYPRAISAARSEASRARALERMARDPEFKPGRRKNHPAAGATPTSADHTANEELQLPVQTKNGNSEEPL